MQKASDETRIPSRDREGAVTKHRGNHDPAIVTQRLQSRERKRAVVEASGKSVAK
jgi:hypothetical protein